jgi:hypothetical protein
LPSTSAVLPPTAPIAHRPSGAGIVLTNTSQAASPIGAGDSLKTLGGTGEGRPVAYWLTENLYAPGGRFCIAGPSSE